MELTYSKLADKQIKLLEKNEPNIFERILIRIEWLKRGVYKWDRLTSKRKLYRLRVGDYRIVYFEEKWKLIIIEMVEKRGRVYRRLK